MGLSGWVLYVRSFGMGLLKLLSFAGERVIDRVFEIGHLLEAAYGQLMLFEIVPDRFDARLLGTVPRQVDQMHVGRRQLGPRLRESLARVDGVVVQRAHQGTPRFQSGEAAAGRPAICHRKATRRSASI